VSLSVLQSNHNNISVLYEIPCTIHQNNSLLSHCIIWYAPPAPPL
jgi:hypothetical protein